jgi:GTP-binding protein YchF
MADITSFTAALVGLPNVGKSSLFNVIVNRQQAESANYPFCTIKPNTAIVDYSDPRLYQLQKTYQSKKVVPSRVNFIDIAGLVKDAADGRGLGNAFLSSIYETDAIVYVQRCFADENILHVEDSVDPIRDFEILRNELKKKDLQMIEAYKASKHYKGKSEVLAKMQEAILADSNIQPIDKSIHLLSCKPFIVLCNGTDYAEDMTAFCDSKNIPYVIVDVSALTENVATNKNQLIINTIIEALRKALGIITFFTAGEQEVHAWDIVQGTDVRSAGGVIHTDFLKTFVRAKITHENKTITVDANYIVQDGDVIVIMNNKK